MSTHVIRNSFNAGEISPLLDSRSDVAQYSSGCRTMQNVMALPFGGAVSRPGMQYMGAAKLANRACRLVPFNFSVTTNFVLEFGHQYVRVWTNGVRVEAVELESPYFEEHLDGLQFRQINDVVYIVHPAFAPRKLTRVADDNWTLDVVAWKYPPMRDENITAGSYITSSAVTGATTLTATTPMFQPSMVGGYFELSFTRQNAFQEIFLTSDQTGTWLPVIGKWDLYTFGIWGASLCVDRTLDGGTTYETTRVFDSNQDRNVAASGNELEWCSLRLRVINYSGSAASSDVATPRAVLELSDTRHRGVVKITGVDTADSLTATGTVIRDLYSTGATGLWSEGAWSDYRGWPRSVELHEQRLVFGGNKSQPSTLWGSVSADFENFERNTNDDGSIAYTIATLESNVIQWLASREGMVIGTSGEEWLMQAANSSEPITPTNVTFKRQSRYGSEHCGAVVINDTLLFIQRGGRKVREFKYAFASDSYVAPDLTLLSEHLLRAGVRQMAFQSHTTAVLWVVTKGGKLIGLTYERDQNVVAWHRHETDGVVESVATIYGDTPGSDELWLVVRRVVGGDYVRYIERFHPLAHYHIERGEKSACFHVDCGTDIQGAVASSVVSGLDWLEGREVAVLADGAVQPKKTVSGGLINLDPPASRVIVGLPFVAEVQPTRTEMQLQDGTSAGRKVRVNRAVFRLWNTLGLQWWDGKEWRDAALRKTDDPMGESAPLFTGEHEECVGNGYEDSVSLAVRQVDPLPLGLLAIVLKVEAYGD